MAEHRVCPWWMGYILASPLRKLVQNPRTILAPYVRPGMTMLDIGCAMGFFSIEMAHMGGKDGKVICVDVQEKMISHLLRRASKAGVRNRIVPHTCMGRSLGLSGHDNGVDFALAFYVIHEMTDPRAFLGELYRVMGEGARFFVTEPSFHVSEADFKKTETLLFDTGFRVFDRPRVFRSRAVVVEK